MKVSTLAGAAVAVLAAFSACSPERSATADSQEAVVDPESSADGPLADAGLIEFSLDLDQTVVAVCGSDALYAGLCLFDGTSGTARVLVPEREQVGDVAWMDDERVLFITSSGLSDVRAFDVRRHVEIETTESTGQAPFRDDDGAMLLFDAEANEAGDGFVWHVRRRTDLAERGDRVLEGLLAPRDIIGDDGRIFVLAALDGQFGPDGGSILVPLDGGSPVEVPGYGPGRAALCGGVLAITEGPDELSGARRLVLVGSLDPTKARIVGDPVVLEGLSGAGCLDNGDFLALRRDSDLLREVPGGTDLVRVRPNGRFDDIGRVEVPLWIADVAP